MTRQRITFIALLLAAGAALAAVAGKDSLAHGQAIKQFFAYSITESLTRRPGPLVLPELLISTQVPCDPPRVWAEEPPVFHGLAAICLRAGAQPWLLPLLGWMALVGALGALASHALRERGAENHGTHGASWIAVALVAAASPAFLRYSVQHLPDLFATAILTWGAYALVLRRRGLTLSLFTLAVTAKALTVFPVVFLLLGEEWSESRRSSGSSRSWRRFALNRGLELALISLPFIAWVVLLKWQAIPSPFVVNHVYDNRHFGSLGHLVSPAYYLRFITWVAVKGVGLVLFAGAAWWLVRFAREMRRPRGKTELAPAVSRFDALLAFWCVGLVFYWLFVRNGNFVHDYYVLPFLPAIALVGARFWAEFPRREVAWTALALNVALGVWPLLTWQAVPYPPEQGRPYFCSWENSEAPRR